MRYLVMTQTPGYAGQITFFCSRCKLNGFKRLEKVHSNTLNSHSDVVHLWITLHVSVTSSETSNIHRELDSCSTTTLEVECSSQQMPTHVCWKVKRWLS